VIERRDRILRRERAAAAVREHLRAWKTQRRVWTRHESIVSTLLSKSREGAQTPSTELGAS
jgi:hypothetical protein